MPVGPDQYSVAPSAPHTNKGHQYESPNGPTMSEGMPRGQASMPLPSASLAASKGKNGVADGTGS